MCLKTIVPLKTFTILSRQNMHLPSVSWEEAETEMLVSSA